MFKAALFVIPEGWKQPRYTSVGKWLNKLQYIYYNDILLRNKKKWSFDTCNKLYESPGNYTG